MEISNLMDLGAPVSRAIKLPETAEEKQTDANIALRLFQIAVVDGYDRAVIVSGDSDLLPSIKAVQATFPAKQIGVIVPIGQASEELIRESDFHYKMKEKHLQSSRYPNEIGIMGRYYRSLKTQLLSCLNRMKCEIYGKKV